VKQPVKDKVLRSLAGLIQDADRQISVAKERIRTLKRTKNSSPSSQMIRSFGTLST